MHQMQFQPDASNAPSNTNIYLIMIYCAWNPPESTWNFWNFQTHILLFEVLLHFTGIRLEFQESGESNRNRRWGTVKHCWWQIWSDVSRWPHLPFPLHAWAHVNLSLLISPCWWHLTPSWQQCHQSLSMMWAHSVCFLSWALANKVCVVLRILCWLGQVWCMEQ